MLIDPYHWHTLRVTAILRESPQAVTIITSRPQNYRFIPGQHTIMRVTLPDKRSYLRQYSFAGIPSGDNLRFTIVQTPDGIVSSWCVTSMQPGDTIEISQPFTGPLAIKTSHYTHIGMIAGGSGIVPIMSHLRHLRKSSPNTSVTLLYSTHRVRQCFKDELSAQNSHELFDIRLTDAGSPRLTPQDIRRLLDTCDSVMICGSRQFVQVMKDFCKSLSADIPVYTEAFSLE